MSPQRVWLAEQLLRWREVKRRGWDRAGKALYDELRAVPANSLTPEQTHALGLLNDYIAVDDQGNSYVSNRAQLGGVLRKTVMDYKNWKKSVTDTPIRNEKSVSK